nr:MAG TPA: hypothetical protein [Caudoviricetes sp.]
MILYFSDCPRTYKVSQSEYVESISKSWIDIFSKAARSRGMVGEPSSRHPLCVR